MAKVQPLKKNVLARKLQKGEQIVNGIVTLAMSHRDDRYLVIAVGPDTKEVIPGDTVYIHPTVASQYVTYENEVLRHVCEDDIYAKEDE